MRLPPREAALLGALLALAAAAAAQFEAPPPPLWHFAVRTADDAAVLIIVSNDWVAPDGETDLPPERYLIQRSADEAFTAPEDLPLGLTPSATGGAWVGIDGAWAPDAPRPWYRVSALGAAGEVLGTSRARQPVDNAGECWVLRATSAAARQLGRAVPPLTPPGAASNLFI